VFVILAGFQFVCQVLVSYLVTCHFFQQRHNVTVLFVTLLFCSVAISAACLVASGKRPMRMLFVLIFLMRTLLKRVQYYIVTF